MISKNNTLIAYDLVKSMDEKIFSTPLPDFIEFAKNYNIFQNSQNKFYLQNVEKIKQRCELENILLDTIKPEE